LLSHTTGTTGIPRFRYRTQQELAVIAEFVDALASALADGTEHGPQPLVLQLAPEAHGMRPQHTGWRQLQCPLVGSRSVDRAAMLLRRRFAVPGYRERIAHVIGTPQQLKKLTMALAQRGLRGEELAVEALHSFSDYVPRGLQRFLERWWGAPLLDTFSMSEVTGSTALAAAGERGYHGFGPAVYPEYVDPFDGTPVREGLALLLLTELVPFSEFAPLVRYCTGDLVEVRPSDEIEGEMYFIHKGRIPYCLAGEVAGRRAIVLTSNEVWDVAEETPEIVQHRPGHHDVLDGLELPHVRFSLVPRDEGPALVQVELELAFDELQFHEAARHVEEGFARRLQAESPSLRAALATGAYALEVRSGRRSLPSPWF
jgi:phenylacetate-coenzyme A ligase PaaK-like adenylate-forming protein